LEKTLEEIEKTVEGAEKKMEETEGTEEGTEETMGQMEKKMEIEALYQNCNNTCQMDGRMILYILKKKLKRKQDWE
jgi:hypothetical protein